MLLKVKKQLIDMLRKIKVETAQLLFDMLRRINVVECEETTYWYVEKDKSWNLAADIWYVKNMNVVESEETTYWYVEKDKSWNLAAAIWYVKKNKCCWKWRNNLLICWEG